jgi:hypothetical protein
MALSRKRAAALRAFHRDAAIAQAQLQAAMQDVEATGAKAQMAVAEAEVLLQKLDNLESRAGPDASFGSMRQDLNAQLESYRASERDARARLARFAKMGEALSATVASVAPPAD